jgi:glycosyltransferase involved in cell wall biosynthesis
MPTTDSATSSGGKRKPSAEAEAELVSVVVPAYNAAATIEETLASVRNQTHGNLDIIVVDDGSVDQTATIVARHCADDRRVRLLRQANGGVAAARNAGVTAALGELVAIIDSDDLWQPSKIERQLRALRAAGPEAALVYCWSAPIDPEGRIIGWGDTPAHFGDVLGQLCYGNFIGNGSAALMRKSAVQAAGGFDPSLRARRAQGCEDWRLYLLIAERHHVALVADQLTGYRQVPGAMSCDVEQMLRSDGLVRSEMLARHPEYKVQLDRGRRTYIHWLMRRELGNRRWNNCLTLLSESLRGESHWRAFLRRGRFLLRLAKAFVTRHPQMAGARFLPVAADLNSTVPAPAPTHAANAPAS